MATDSTSFTGHSATRTKGPATPKNPVQDRTILKNLAKIVRL